MSFPRLRIAFITFKFGHQYGGAEAYGVELMLELAKHHDVFVYTHEYDSKCLQQFNHKVVTAPKNGPSWWRIYCYAKNIEQELSNQQFDIIHSHINGWVADVDVLHVKSVRYHAITKANPIQKLLHRLSPRLNMYLRLEKQRIHTKPPKRTVVVSEQLKKQIQKAYKTRYPFDVITPGVHLPTLDPALRQNTRAKLGFSAKDTVCLLVARNPKNKGLSCLQAGLQLLPEHIKLLIVGVSPNELPNLQNQLHQLKLHQRVTLIAQTPNVDPYYQAADLCVHPTLNDSFGMAPLEAMSYGLPVILSSAAYCGFSHYVTDQENAFILHDPHNVDELAQAITKITMDTELAQRLQRQGLTLAKQFSWSSIAQRYLLIYAEVLAARLHQRKPTLIDPLAD